MQIRKAGDSIKLESKFAKVLVFPTDKSIKSVGPDIVLGMDIEDCFSVNSPGEYESKEVWIMGFNTDMNEMGNNVYVVSLEGINVAILGEDIKKLSKKQVEKIGLIDICIAKPNEKLESVLDTISEIDPKVLMPIDFTGEDIDTTAKKLGVKNIEEETKYKAKMDDFAKDDYQLQIVKI